MPPPDPASMIVIFRTMLRLLETGHAKGCYARAAEADSGAKCRARPKGKPSPYGNRGGPYIRRCSPDAKHFSITGAYLQACDSSDVPLNVEWACLKLLERAAEGMGIKLPEEGLEGWNDTTATQTQIIAVVNRALDLVVAKASSTTPSSKGHQPCSTKPSTRPPRQPAELLF
jgi:hypothetical protein